MTRLTKLFGKLRLKINAAKSAVAPVWERQFLGLAFWVAPGGKVKRRVAKKALQAMKTKVKEITDRNGGRSLLRVVEELKRYLTGWRAYFRLADTPGIFADLDGWIRRRLRLLQLKQWKRGTTAFRELRARGVSYDTAVGVARNLRRWWHHAKQLSHVAFPNRYYDELGVPRLAT